VPISAYWQKFIDEYASYEAYWYFPKGGTADKDEFREQFRIFDLFEGEIFTPDLQAKIGAELRAEGLTSAGDDFPRQIKRVFENMGLCWIEEGRPIRVTPAGRLYLEEPPGPSKVLDQQVWRYQMPSPVNSSEATAGIELHPHAFLVEALLNCNGEVTGQEFILFVSRARAQDDLKKTVDRIRAWRKLLPATRTDIIRELGNSDYSKIKGNHTYSMAFHHYLIRPHRAEPLLDLVRREAARGAAKPLQCFVGKEPSNLTQNLSACGRPFGCVRPPASPRGNDGRQGYRAGLIHAKVSLYRWTWSAR
jgi:hypothetical protein